MVCLHVRQQRQRRYACDSAIPRRSSVHAAVLYMNIHFSRRVFVVIEKAQKKKVTQKHWVCHRQPLACGPRLGRCSETFGPMPVGVVEAVGECIVGNSWVHLAEATQENSKEPTEKVESVRTNRSASFSSLPQL